MNINKEKASLWAVVIGFSFLTLFILWQVGFSLGWLNTLIWISVAILWTVGVVAGVLIVVDSINQKSYDTPKEILYLVGGALMLFPIIGGIVLLVARLIK